jgi:hypothetical protein
VGERPTQATEVKNPELLRLSGSPHPLKLTDDEPMAAEPFERANAQVEDGLEEPEPARPRHDDRGCGFEEAANQRPWGMSQSRHR